MMDSSASVEAGIRAGHAGPTCSHAEYRQFTVVDLEAPVSDYVTNASTCSDCKIILEAVKAEKPGWIAEPSIGAKSIVIERQDWDWMAKVSLLDEDEETGSFWLLRRSSDDHLYEKPESDDGNLISCARLGQTQEITPDSSSDAAMERAARWLAHCVENDEACEKPDRDFMPQRLINVGPKDGSRQPFLFEPDQPAPYACLSYCWGPDVEGILKTTTENLGSHHQAIPLHEMPLGIQDAIRVCRGLDIANLWVDSLCLVQDDHAAWLRESSEMHLIYLNSHLSISALEPASCKSRFLGEQRFGSPGWQRLLTIDLVPTDGDVPFDVFVRPSSTYEDPVHVPVCPKPHLDKRGWCLQESILPNRRLCFNGDEMVWQCLCRNICECGHTLWSPQDADYAELGSELKQARLRAEVDLPYFRVPMLPRRSRELRMAAFGHKRHLDQRRSMWRDLVTEYSTRALTRVTDKLVAVSALAKIAHDGLEDGHGRPDEYLAGLWRREFHYDLAWYVVEHRADGPPYVKAGPSRKYVNSVPSWSWASVDKAVAYDFLQPDWVSHGPPELKNCCIVESAACQLELPEDATGAVLGGRVLLGGALAPVVLSGSKYDRDLDTKLHSSVVFGDTIGRPVVTLLDPSLSLDCHCRGLSWKPCCSWASAQRGGERDAESYFCFRLFSWASHLIEEPASDTWFLVLKRSDRIPGAFERIGVGCWSYFHEGYECPFFDNVEPTTIEIV